MKSCILASKIQISVEINKFHFYRFIDIALVNDKIFLCEKITTIK